MIRVAASRAQRVAGRLSAVLLAVFGLGHLAWAAGARVLGATDEQFSIVGQGSLRHLLPECAIGLFALVAAFLTLALVESWARRLPSWLMKLTVCAGAPLAVAATVYGFIGLCLQTLSELGRYQFLRGHEMTAPPWWCFWYGLFLFAGASFIVTIGIGVLNRAGGGERKQVKAED